jgi:hypothetical protein
MCYRVGAIDSDDFTEYLMRSLMIDLDPLTLSILLLSDRQLCLNPLLHSGRISTIARIDLKTSAAFLYVCFSKFTAALGAIKEPYKQRPALRFC